MKSYFAKLAARATLTNTPVPLPVSAPKPQDSFSGTFGFATPATAHRVDQFPGSREHATDRVSPGPLLTSTANLRPHKTSDVATERLVQDRSESLITHIESSPTRVSPPETTREAPEIQSLNPRPVLPDSFRIGRADQDQSQTQQNKVSLTKSHVASNEAKETEATRDEGLQEQPRETQYDQSVLLRKADDFMEALFARQRSVAPDEGNSERETESPKSAPVVRRESPARLQPLTRLPQIPEPVEDEPSLVIEKLTVEVVSPPTQPIKPQRQVVVVREARDGRRAVPSSRRFGLNHF
jgi:hypothetical protein